MPPRPHAEQMILNPHTHTQMKTRLRPTWMEPMSKVAASEDGVKIGVTAALSSMAGIFKFLQKFKKANQGMNREE